MLLAAAGHPLFRAIGAVCGSSICRVIFMQQGPRLSPRIRAICLRLRHDMFIAVVWRCEYHLRDKPLTR